MSQEERLMQLIREQESLFWVEDFLSEHPEANLYLVGGAVRDGLLGRKMRTIDFDFVIQGLAPEKIETWFSAFGGLSLVGQHFGVYKFLPTGFTTDQIEFIDIALPRTEAVKDGALGGYKDFDIQSDPSLPIEDDLARRDFTINAMAFDLRTRKLTDPFNGQVDLEDRRIRAVGDPAERFQEDLSRMLRGLRFAAELHFDIEDTTSKAIVDHIIEINRIREIDGKQVFVVPREIIGLEITKALSRSPVKAIKEFLKHGVLSALLPEVQRIVEVDERYLDPLWEVRADEPTITIALLLRGLSEQTLKEAIRFAGLDTMPKGSSSKLNPDLVLWLIKQLHAGLTTKTVDVMPASSFERKFMNGKGELLNRCLELLGQGDVAQSARDRRQNIEGLWLVDSDETIAPLLSGNDILASGIDAGPGVRLILDHIRDKQLDGKLMTREAALKYIKNQKNTQD
ncbi:MAG: CCA tRNA nucleotidyltransferase [Parcubacteria group bacterium]|nr:CCA tRNA nucleotidyltransferase [Parcubacteria group bacterium]